MPLPPEMLEDIKRRIDDVHKAIYDLEETISDLREAGIDAAREEEELREARKSLRQLEVFYGLQIKRAGITE